MDWNTQFTQMMGDATEMMYGTHFLNATEALQRVLLGKKLQKRIIHPILEYNL